VFHDLILKDRTCTHSKDTPSLISFGVYGSSIVQYEYNKFKKYYFRLNSLLETISVGCTL
jgi:hypothetical protein